MAACPTVKVKPWGKDQGDFVEINAEDFDPKVHKLAAGESAPEIEPVPEVVADPMPPNPDDLVVPPLEQVANYAPPPEPEAPAPKAPEPPKQPHRRRRRKARK